MKLAEGQGSSRGAQAVGGVDNDTVACMNAANEGNEAKALCCR